LLDRLIKFTNYESPYFRLVFESEILVFAKILGVDKILKKIDKHYRKSFYQKNGKKISIEKEIEIAEHTFYNLEVGLKNINYKIDYHIDPNVSIFENYIYYFALKKAVEQGECPVLKKDIINYLIKEINSYEHIVIESLNLNNKILQTYLSYIEIKNDCIQDQKTEEKIFKKIKI